jgi:hypothetical protein
MVCTQLLGTLAAPVAILVAMAYSDITASIAVMALLLALFYLVEGKWQVAAIAFAMGFCSDLALNYYSRRTHAGLRSRRLHEYFTRVGPVKAAAFAGLLTVWLVLPSVALWEYIGAESGLSPFSPWALLPLGFMVGAVTGVFSQTTQALEPLLPFYQATSGNLENRAWDGASVVFAMVPVAVLLAG